MVEVYNTPLYNNFLSPVGYKFQLRKLPIFEHYVQSVKFPDVEMIMNPGQATPFIRIPLVGNALEFREIVVTFKVDTYMVNYTEIYDWMHGIGRVESFQPYADLAKKSNGFGIEADATLVVLDSSMDASINFYFEDLFPTKLSGFTFDSRDDKIDYITSDVTFVYRSFQYEVFKKATE